MLVVNCQINTSVDKVQADKDKSMHQWRMRMTS